MSTHYALIGYVAVLLLKWVLLAVVMYFVGGIAARVLTRWLIRREMRRNNEILRKWFDEPKL